MRLVIITALLWFSAPAFAQDQKSLDLAGKVVDEMHLDTTIAATVDPLIAAQVAENPQLAPVEDVMRAFFKKYFTSAEIRPHLAKLYAQTFDNGELKVLLKFYKTSAGQKMLAKDEELTAAAGEIGRQIVLDHQAELMQDVMKKMLSNAGQ